MNSTNVVTVNEPVTIYELAGSPQQVLQSALAALDEGRVSDVVDQFADRFTFNSHALRLELADKPRLTKFFKRFREVFPDTSLEIGSLLESGDHAIAEWQLSATENVPLVSISHRVPVSLHGSTVICVKDGKIVQWSEYYDQSNLPIHLGAFFTNPQL
jgi:ketosteroid isomerase-like protein